MKTFELRLIPPDLHAAIKAAAFREGVSMNKWILRALTEKIKIDAIRPDVDQARKYLDEMLK